jgi:hypothetical protein
MPTHFIKALGISSRSQTMQKTKKNTLHENSVDADSDRDEELNDSNEEYDEDLDIDIRMEVEAFPDEAEALLASASTDYDAGDVVGKLMAFINQVRMSSEVTREYLKELCVSNSLPPLELKLWCRTRWGSLSDCLRVVLEVRDVSFIFLIIYYTYP